MQIMACVKIYAGLGYTNVLRFEKLKLRKNVIFFVYFLIYYSHNINVEGRLLSTAPECVDADCWNRSFSSPPAAPETRL